MTPWFPGQTGHVCYVPYQIQEGSRWIRLSDFFLILSWREINLSSSLDHLVGNQLRLKLPYEAISDAKYQEQSPRPTQSIVNRIPDLFVLSCKTFVGLSRVPLHKETVNSDGIREHAPAAPVSRSRSRASERAVHRAAHQGRRQGQRG